MHEQSAFFDPAPIEQFVQAAVDPAALRRRTEFWLAVFPSLCLPSLDYDLLMALIELFRARTGTSADWLCAQDCRSNETLYDLLLASAAILLAFPQRSVNGHYYVDGQLADNVPLGALTARGCTHAIVIHLQSGSVWDRHRFPDQLVIEIRPQALIDRCDTPIVGAAGSLLDFSSDRIAELKQRGYANAQRCLQPILQSLSVVAEGRQQLSLRKSTQRLLMIHRCHNDLR